MCSILLGHLPDGIDESVYAEALIKNNCFGHVGNDAMSQVEIDLESIQEPIIFSISSSDEDKATIIGVRNQDGVKYSFEMKVNESSLGTNQSELIQVEGKNISYMLVKILDDGRKIFMITIGENKEFYWFYVEGEKIKGNLKFLTYSKLFLNSNAIIEMASSSLFYLSKFKLIL